MKNSFFNKPIGNVYLKPSLKSDLSTQILYGEKFKILSKNKGWIKIKTDFDKYSGFIRNGIFINSLKPTHKIFLTKSVIYKKVNVNFIKTQKNLYFSSTIQNLEYKNGYIRFERNKWIKKKRCQKN